MRVLSLRPRRVETVIPTDHLSASELAAYVDHSLTDASRERAERHISECSQCRDEVVACARLAAAAPSSVLRRMRYVAPIVGAAAAVVVAVAIGASRRGGHGPATERSAGAIAREVAIVSPRDGGSLVADSVRFTWRSDSGAVGYRVVVTTVSGATVWVREVQDTSVAPLSAATFVNGEEYYWRVESSTADGGWAASRPSAFRIVDR